MALQDKLDVLTAELIASGQVPAAALATLRRTTLDLIASGAADRALMAGQSAPSFALKDAQGVVVRSNKLLERGPLVMAFHLGIWCPYCALELQALEAARGEIERRGASIVSLSMQTAANSLKSTRDNALGFPLLVDFRGTVAAKFGLRTSMPHELVALHKEVLGNDLEEINGEGSWTLPMPALYVIGQDGIVAYAEVCPDFRNRSEPENLLPVLDCLAHRRMLSQLPPR